MAFIAILMKIGKARTNDRPCLVFDPFCGAGSIALTCRMMNCLSVNMDIDDQCREAINLILENTLDDVKYREFAGLLTDKDEESKEDDNEDKDEDHDSDEEEEEEQGETRAKRKHTNTKEVFHCLCFCNIMIERLILNFRIYMHTALW